MKRERKQWLLAAVFLLAILCIWPATARAQEPQGRIIMSVEKKTLGQGYIMEPEYVPFYAGDTMATVTLRELTRIGRRYNYDGRINSGFYLSEISDPDRGAENIPQYIQDTIKALKFSLHKDYTPDYLGEFDYSQQSGWMYSINGEFPNVSACEMRPRDGQTLRWQFTMVGLGRDLGGDKEYFTENGLKGLNTEELSRLVAMVKDRPEVLKEAKVKAAYDRCLQVSKNINAFKQELASEFTTLRHALHMDVVTDIRLFDGVSDHCVVKYGTALEQIPFPSYFKALKDGKTEINITKVTWYCQQEYNSHKAGTYVFSPGIPDTYLIDEGASLPTFTVTVQNLGDINDDGTTDEKDLELLIPHIGEEAEPDEDGAVYDLNGDKRINMADYSLLAGALADCGITTKDDGRLELVFDQSLCGEGETGTASLVLYSTRLDTLGVQLSYDPEKLEKIAIEPLEGFRIERSVSRPGGETVLLGRREGVLSASGIHGACVAKISFTCLTEGKPEITFGEAMAEFQEDQSPAGCRNGYRVDLDADVNHGEDFRLQLQLGEGKVRNVRFTEETEQENGVEVRLATASFAASDVEDVPENRVRARVQADSQCTVTIGGGVEDGRITEPFSVDGDGTLLAAGQAGCFTGGASPQRENHVLYMLVESSGVKTYYKIRVERRGYEAVTWKYGGDAPFILAGWSAGAPDILTAAWDAADAQIRGWDAAGDPVDDLRLILPGGDSSQSFYIKNQSGQKGTLCVKEAGDYWMEIVDGKGEVRGKVRVAAVYPSRAADYYIEQAKNISLDKEDYDASAVWLLLDYNHYIEQAENIQDTFPKNVPVYLDGMGRYTAQNTGRPLTDDYGYAVSGDSLRTEAVNDLRMAMEEIMPQLLAMKKAPAQTKLPEKEPAKDSGVSGGNDVQKEPEVPPTEENKPPAAKKKKPVFTCTKTVTKEYPGKAFTLSVKTDSDGKATYHTSNKKVITVSGKGKVKIKGMGQATVTVKTAATAKYKAGQVKITVKIIPGKVKGVSVSSPKARTFKIKWKKLAKTGGYQIQYARDKSFKKKVKTARAGAGKTVLTVKKLTRKKTYYVRIRAYKKVSGKTVYGKWSAKKKVKIK